MAGETKGKLVCIGAVLVLCAGCGLFWPKPVQQQEAQQKQHQEVLTKLSDIGGDVKVSISTMEKAVQVQEQSQGVTKVLAEKIETLNQETTNRFNDLSDNQLKQNQGNDAKFWSVLIMAFAIAVVAPSGPMWFRVGLLVTAGLILVSVHVLFPLLGVLL